MPSNFQAEESGSSDVQPLFTVQHYHAGVSKKPWVSSETVFLFLAAAALYYAINFRQQLAKRDWSTAKKPELFCCWWSLTFWRGDIFTNFPLFIPNYCCRNKFVGLILLYIVNSQCQENPEYFHFFGFLQFFIVFSNGQEPIDMRCSSGAERQCSMQ